MLRKHVSNDIPDWLNMIAIGKKTYEGRLASKIQEWDLYIGKQMIFFDGKGLEVTVEVTSLLRFKNFGDAFENLGHKLIPIRGTTIQSAIQIYRDVPYTDEEVAQKGVVAIGVKVIKVENI